ncbi:unknown [Neodiprion lecontei nucleopolyhedrovirus]|uniref:Uncharacterized protein n=1 Tax=Neodiprion lecontei nucleopolyhedrovirus (strain Canada) TaxID=654906 RepID=Q6JPG8_NPVNC|nr:unknown [Neodiprion lecontei nucleopolyhedrovirus]AAQ99048.1 unknown [Neodiprion lecontei nucleopolyhedrovirus]
MEGLFLLHSKSFSKLPTKHRCVVKRFVNQTQVCIKIFFKKIIHFVNCSFIEIRKNVGVDETVWQTQIFKNQRCTNSTTQI